jgi:hypothetical protein
MLASENASVDFVVGPPDLPGSRYVAPQEIFGLPSSLPGSRSSSYEEMFGLPSRLPGARVSAGDGMFGLGQEDKPGPGWLTITLGITAAAAVAGLAYCLLGGSKPQPRGMTLGEARQRAGKAARACR